MSKFLYIVDHYVPFPSSEYGGVWNVIAESDDECFDLIVEEDGNSLYEKYYSNLRQNIQDSYCFEIVDDKESRIVMEFTT